MKLTEHPEFQRLLAENKSLISEIDILRESLDSDLISVGYYSFSHRLDTAAAYKERLDGLKEEIKDSIKSGAAILAAEGFIYNNSLAKGKKMVKDLAKLMLRAYNAEAENCVKTVRATSLQPAIKRLERTSDSIAKQGELMQMKISPEYHTLRINEIKLTVDYLMKVQEEREAAREERARLRQERKAQAELAAQREKIEKEESHLRNVIERLLSDSDERRKVENRLSELATAREENDYRAANIRAGYVYVISNIGAFGRGIIKIGMTRRLEPMDRVHELGSASVPFKFDVHAMFFSDDAVGVEAELHRRFADRRVNRVNLRREFFYATPLEVKHELESVEGSLLEFILEPEAEQFHLSRDDMKKAESAEAMENLGSFNDFFADGDDSLEIED